MNYSTIKVTREEYDTWEIQGYPDWATAEMEDLGFCFHYCFYPEYEDNLPDSDYALFALGDEGYLLGYCVINVENSVDTLEVFPEYRLQGIAKRLLKEANCYDPWCNQNVAFWSHIKNTLVRTK
jgi:GNAT superfamily N-acetyltransferase